MSLMCSVTLIMQLKIQRAWSGWRGCLLCANGTRWTSSWGNLQSRKGNRPFTEAQVQLLKPSTDQATSSQSRTCGFINETKEALAQQTATADVPESY
jgi:hypothetical protein